MIEWEHDGKKENTVMEKTEKKKTTQIVVRMVPEEKQALMDKLRERDMELSDYIRTLIEKDAEGGVHRWRN